MQTMLFEPASYLSSNVNSTIFLPSYVLAFLETATVRKRKVLKWQESCKNAKPNSPYLN
jgi:hypothetical protein